MDDRIAQFRKDGFTIFEAAHAPGLLTRWQAAYDAICDREGERVWLNNAAEIDPELFLPAIANPRIIDFAESVMGPFVQLDSLSINAFPSVAPGGPEANAWHRDRYSEVPQTTDYLHPLGINTIFYFQDLTDAFGPLRVVPGSHREPIVFDASTRTAARADERLLYPKAGDVVVTHYLLAHSGTPNTSGRLRYFMSASYNRSWMRTVDPHDGPHVRALVERARAAGDRRLMRLFGEDEQRRERSNPYWASGREDERWAAWIAEDRAALANTTSDNPFIETKRQARTVDA